MANYKIVDADRLDADMTGLADVIRQRAGTAGKLEFPEEMKEAVRNIRGGVELPALDNPGTAGDLAKGKQLIGADGKLVTGTIEDGFMWHYHYDGSVSAYEEDGAICFDHAFDKDVLYRKGEHIILCHSDLGDALPQEVVKGRTFTTSKGVKIEGTVKEVATVYNTPFQKATLEWDDDWKVSNVLEEDVLLRKGTAVNTWFGAGFFGNALPGDVAKGKTFTSGSGVKIEGTMEPGSGGVQMHVDGETLVITGAVTVENDTLIL